MTQIQYKGKAHQLNINNGTLLRFERAGGQFSKLQDQPISQMMLLLCAALQLDGDPVEHADHFPPLAELMPVLQTALEDSGFTDTSAPTNPKNETNSSGE